MRLWQRAAGRFDVAVVRFAQVLGQRPSFAASALEVRRAQLEVTARAYANVAQDAFYAAPAPIADLRSDFVRDLPGGGEVVDLAWTSGWHPHDPAGRAEYLRFEENRTAHARLLRHARPSPAMLCLHGYRAGAHRFEEMAWNAQRFYQGGLDVALLTLPFHALRAVRGRLSPAFPSARAGRTVEAFGQAVHDARSLLAWLRGRGAPAAGVAGMSLGGYTAALLATVERQLDFAVFFIPLGDLTDVTVEHEALRGRQVPEELREAGRRALHLVRPLARRPLLAPERTLVVAAAGDRITKTGTHADRLAAHFGARKVTFPGSHLVQLGRERGLRAMEELIDSAVR